MTSAKVRDLQSQVTSGKAEIANLKDQLTNARNASTQFKEIAEATEKRLLESSNAAKALKDDLEARLSKAVEEKVS